MTTVNFMQNKIYTGATANITTRILIKSSGIFNDFFYCWQFRKYESCEKDAGNGPFQALFHLLQKNSLQLIRVHWSVRIGPYGGNS